MWESAAIGLMAGRFAAADRLGAELPPPPPETALGALLAHVSGGHLTEPDARARSFQPMNINYGLLPILRETPRKDADGRRIPPAERGRAKKRAMSERALKALEGWAAAGGGAGGGLICVSSPGGRARDWPPAAAPGPRSRPPAAPQRPPQNPP